MYVCIGSQWKKRTTDATFDVANTNLTRVALWSLVRVVVGSWGNEILYRYDKKDFVRLSLHQMKGLREEKGSMNRRNDMNVIYIPVV